MIISITMLKELIFLENKFENEENFDEDDMYEKEFPKVFYRQDTPKKPVKDKGSLERYGEGMWLEPGSFVACSQKTSPEPDEHPFERYGEGMWLEPASFVVFGPMLKYHKECQKSIEEYRSIMKEMLSKCGKGSVSLDDVEVVPTPPAGTKHLAIAMRNLRYVMGLGVLDGTVYAWFDKCDGSFRRDSYNEAELKFITSQFHGRGWGDKNYIIYIDK